jgi:DNA-binding transcriptional ArsR family regulator
MRQFQHPELADVPLDFDVDIAQSTLSHHVKTLRDAPLRT